MKVSKKIAVPFLAAVIGLSMAGGIGGAFAWYQYNSQVTASFVGSSVADTSVLQIGHYSGNDIVWERDFVQPNANLVPVTFGQLTTANSKADSLGTTYAYGYPEAGKQVNDNYSSWTRINPGQGFVQFDIYLRSLQADGSSKPLDVYLSNITIEAVSTGANPSVLADDLLADAVRVHLDVEGNTNRLISKTAISSENHLPLFGNLDLDGDGHDDTVGGYRWQTGRDSLITYGIAGQYQTTSGITDVVQARDADGTFTNADAAKRICTTKSSNANTAAGWVKITTTVWLEGWSLLNVGSNSPSNLWNPSLSAGCDVRVGMTFDTGKVRVNNNSSSQSSESSESAQSSESSESAQSSEASQSAESSEIGD